MKPKDNADNAAILNFLTQAYFDYLAARILLLKKRLLQGHLLAHYSIEKYFKALIIFTGNKVRGHEISTAKFIKKIKEISPKFYEDLNQNFLYYIEKAFELRYWDNQKKIGHMLLQKRHTLYELDLLVYRIEDSISFNHDEDRNIRFYFADHKNNNPDLMTDNYVLGNPKPFNLQKFDETIEFIGLNEFDSRLTITRDIPNVAYDGSFPINEDYSFRATENDTVVKIPKYPIKR